MKGVPLRIDIGPRDLESGSAPMSRRDGGPRATIPLLPEPATAAEGAQEDGDREEVVARAARLLVLTVLEDVGATLLRQAEERLATAIVDVDDYGSLLACWGKEDGPEPGRGEGFRWARVWWDGDEEDEAAVQSATGATLRCFPLPSDDHGNGDDERCGGSSRSDGSAVSDTRLGCAQWAVRADRAANQAASNLCESLLRRGVRSLRKLVLAIYSATASSLLDERRPFPLRAPIGLPS